VSSTLPIRPRLRTQHETEGEAAEYSSEAMLNAIGDISLTFLISKTSKLEIAVKMLRCCLNAVFLRVFEEIFGQAVLSQKEAAYVSVTVATVWLYCWVCFIAMMHSSSQRVQGTNLLQLPVSHRLQCSGTRAIKFDHCATPIFMPDTSCTV
jgi:hypothetical protein